MPIFETPPTDYPEVNAVLGELFARVQTTLAERFVGMYLYGSLALDEFSPETSDIDFLVVTSEGVTESMFAALRAMHAQLGTLDTKWATQLEGAYISRQALRRYDRARAHHPHIDRDGSDLIIRQFESDWVIQRYVLREYGITLAGPKIRTLIDPISSAELRLAVLDLLRIWWEPMLSDPSHLVKPGYRTYAILTMCRMLYTLEVGTVVSKPAAARWAETVLGEPWADLVGRARAWSGTGEPGSVDEALGLLRYTVGRSREFESPNPQQ